MCVLSQDMCFKPVNNVAMLHHVYALVAKYLENLNTHSNLFILMCAYLFLTATNDSTNTPH